MTGFARRDLTRPMTMNLKPVPGDALGTPVLTVCVNVRPENGISVSCGPRGGSEIADALEREVATSGLDIRIATIRCLGLCEKGPNVRLVPGNSWFHGVRPADVPELVATVARHLARPMPNAAKHSED